MTSQGSHLALGWRRERGLFCSPWGRERDAFPQLSCFPAPFGTLLTDEPFGSSAGISSLPGVEPLGPCMWTLFNCISCSHPVPPTTLNKSNGYRPSWHAFTVVHWLCDLGQVPSLLWPFSHEKLDNSRPWPCCLASSCTFETVNIVPTHNKSGKQSTCSIQGIREPSLKVVESGLGI